MNVAANPKAFVTPEIIQYVADTIVRAVNPEQIFVFGSHAQNSAQWDSDLDLFVVMDTDLPFIARALKIRNLFDPLPCPMDIVVYTPEEVAYWRDLPSSFVHQVLTKGQLLYERTAKKVGQAVDSKSGE